jgi:O-antigen ligase
MNTSIFPLARWSTITTAITLLFGAALLFGGASRLHEVRLAVVELAALPLLVVSATMIIAKPPHPTPFSLSILLCAAAVPLVQLVPLPSGVWTTLPGRDQLVLALELAGIQPTWAPLTFTPDRTWKSFLAILPPVAMFLGFSICSSAVRLRLIHALLGFTVLSVILGTAQLASGGDQLYLWSTTAPTNVVGFFANRNHLATLCLLTIPFAAVLGARALRKPERGSRLTFWLSVLFVAMMVLALGVIRSRMGIVLLAPALAGSLLAAWVASGGGRPKPMLLALIGGAAAAAGAVMVFALAPLLSRFDTAGAREGRFENWPVVAEAAETYLPLGSGLGSFDTVYRSVEPLERLDATFFNQAHNDYLEIWLETGWLGAALFLAFLVWFVKRTWSAWRSRPALERDLQRAASVAIGIVLMHSAVDYPLRTETIAVIFAMCCALLELAARTDEELSTAKTRRGRRARETD